MKMRYKQIFRLIKVAMVLCVILTHHAFAYSPAELRGFGHPVDNDGYPYFPRTNLDMVGAIDTIDERCASAKLDTKKEHGYDKDDHHQSIVKSNGLNGIGYNYWVTHSEMDDGEVGQLLRFQGSKWDFATDGLVKSGKVLPLSSQDHLTFSEERHPSQAVWLPDVALAGSGYLFVAMETSNKIAVWHYDGSQPYLLQDMIYISSFKPNIVSMHRKGDYYWLMVGRDSDSDSKYVAYVAEKSALFPNRDLPGTINIQAFTSVGNIKTLSQKEFNELDKPICFGQNSTLVQDGNMDYYLLSTVNAHMSYDWAYANGKDYVVIWDVEIRNPDPAIDFEGSFTINPTNKNPQIRKLSFPEPNVMNLENPNCAAGCTFSTDIYGRLFLDAVAFYARLDGWQYTTSFSECTTESIYGPLSSMGKCMDAEGASSSNGTNIVLWQCNGGNNQKWLMDETGRFHSAMDYSKCLDIEGANSSNGANVILWKCHNNLNQQWYWDGNMIRSKMNGKAIDVEGASSSNGANILMWPPNGNANQQWVTNILIPLAN